MGKPQRAAAEEEDRYLTLDELAKYSSLSRRTLLLHINSPFHPLPVYRFGRRYAIKRSEYDAWAQKFREGEPTDEISARVDARLARR